MHIYLLHCANVGIYSEWHPLVTKLEQLLPGQGMSYLVEFTQAQIAERVNATKGDSQASITGNDFLTRLLKMHAEAPDKFTMRDVMGAALTNVGAGSDTSSISLSAIMFYLLKTPGVVAKVRERPFNSPLCLTPLPH